MISYNEISKLVWHEFGHFCVDLLLIENTDFKITSIKFQFKSDNNGGCKLQFSVTCKNEKITNEKVLISNGTSEEKSLSIMTLMAGSVFESVYMKEYYNLIITPFNILSIGSAIHDAQKMKSIIEEIGLNKEKQESWIKFRNNFLEEFFEVIFKNELFITNLGIIINPIINKIENIYNSPNLNFTLELTVNEIDILIIRIKELMLSEKLSNNVFEDLNILQKKISQELF